MTTSAPTSFAGPPNDDPAWLSIGLGRWSFPPVPGFDGFVEVETDEASKLDQQKSKGKSKAKTKVDGKDTTKGKCSIEWSVAIWTEARQFTIGISPNGPDAGGPFDCLHPEWNDRGVTSIIIKKLGKLERKPGGKAFKQSFDWEEWTDPKSAATATGTKTPDKADASTDGDGDADVDAKPKGFDGDSAPTPEYTGQRGKS